MSVYLFKNRVMKLVHAKLNIRVNVSSVNDNTCGVRGVGNDGERLRIKLEC